MKFIVDAQLPPQLATWLRSRDFQAVSLRELGLQTSSDSAVWELAIQEEAIIITKDEDFALLAAVREGPSILWVRTGNLVNRLLLAHFEQAWPEVVNHFAAGARVVELR